MRAVILATAVLLATQTQAIAADPPTDLKGVKVLPKLDAVVKAGNKTIDGNGLNLPWTVKDVKGELLLIGDFRKGWVQRSQVVTLDEAPDYYTHIVDSGENVAWAYGCRAIAWKLKGDLDSAIADYGEELRLNPTAAAYYNRGGAWLVQKEYDQAIADFDQAIRLDPNDSLAYVNRGTAWAFKKNYDKALADFDKAIHLDPNDPFVFNNTAWLWATAADARFRNGKKAIELATKACELTGWRHAKPLATLGEAYAEAGDFDSAIKYQNRAIELNPNDAEFLNKSNERLKLYRGRQPYREK